MATEKRSIEISYKADLKDLLSKLKSLPNVTAKEAKQMVGELNKQLKRAEAEAKKTGQAMKKAGQQGAAGFKSATNALREFKDAGDEAEDRLEGVADQSGEVDRGFAAIGLALNQVNPALGEAAMMGADVAAVSEGLILTFKNLNPIVLAASAAVGAIALGYTAYQESAEKARQKTIAIRLAEKEHSDTLEIAKINLDAAKLSFQDINDELLVYQGRLSESTLELKRLTRATRDQFSTADINERVKALEQDAELISQAANNYKLLSDAEKERLDTLMQQTRGIEEQNFLYVDGEKRIKNLQLIMADINSKLDEEHQRRLAIIEEQDKAVKSAQELFKLKQADNKAAEEAEKKAENAASRAEREAAAAEKKAKIEQEEIEEAIEASRAENELLERKQELKSMFISLTETENEKAARAINERAQLEKKAASDLGLMTDELEMSKSVIHEIEKQRIKELAELHKKFQQEKLNDIASLTSSFANDLNTLSQLGLDTLKDQQKAQEDRINEKFDLEEKHLKAIFKGEEDKDKLQAALAKSEMNRKKELANADGFFLNRYFVDREEAALALFRLQKSAALVDIAMQTAVNTVEAHGNPFLTAAAIAKGAAQAAVVASQKPPEFHMGGLAPDERRATLLTGEAILDRTTTRSLGPEGVRRLQNGATAGEIIIMQPFKHFDRYNKSARKRTGRPLGSAGY